MQTNQVGTALTDLESGRDSLTDSQISQDLSQIDYNLHQALGAGNITQAQLSRLETDLNNVVAGAQGGDYQGALDKLATDLAGQFVTGSGTSFQNANGGANGAGWQDNPDMSALGDTSGDTQGTTSDGSTPSATSSSGGGTYVPGNTVTDGSKVDSAANDSTFDTANHANANAAGQNGSGWGSEDLSNPARSATYKGLTLDQMLAMPNSLVAQEIGNRPDVVAAIRQVSQQYGVPDGLLASTIIQETNGDNTRNDATGNSGYGDKPADQQVDAGLTQAPLWAFAGSTTDEKWNNALDPVTNISYLANELAQNYQSYGSWGTALRIWNSGAANTGNLNDGINGDGTGSYVKNILGNIAMGGSDYGS